MKIEPRFLVTMWSLLLPVFALACGAVPRPTPAPAPMTGSGVSRRFDAVERAALCRAVNDPTRGVQAIHSGQPLSSWTSAREDLADVVAELRCQVW